MPWLLPTSKQTAFETAMDRLEKAALMRLPPPPEPGSPRSGRRQHRGGGAPTSPSARSIRSASSTPLRSTSYGLASHQRSLEEEACAVCGSEEVSNANSIVFCDLCDVAVHQVCALYLWSTSYG